MLTGFVMVSLANFESNTLTIGLRSIIKSADIYAIAFVIFSVLRLSVFRQIQKRDV